MRPDYCTQNNGECETCSLKNYGTDCKNNPVGRGGPGRGQGRKQLAPGGTAKLTASIRQDQAEWLDNQENKSAAVRAALDMAMRKSTGEAQQ